jgi:hypothetical protein
MAQRLANKADSVLSIVTAVASKNPNSWDLLRVVEYVPRTSNDSSMSAHSPISVLSSRCLREISEDRNLLPDHKFPEFFNSEEKQHTIKSLEDKLDQVFSVVSPPYHCGLTLFDSIFIQIDWPPDGDLGRHEEG